MRVFRSKISWNVDIRVLKYFSTMTVILLGAFKVGLNTLRVSIWSDRESFSSFVLERSRFHKSCLPCMIIRRATGASLYYRTNGRLWSVTDTVWIYQSTHWSFCCMEKAWKLNFWICEFYAYLFRIPWA